MLPNDKDHLPGETPNWGASSDDRRQRDADAAKLLAAELVGKRQADRGPEARNASRRTGTLTLDKRG